MTEIVFSGKTGDAEAPFLDAKFWKKGLTVLGVVERTFETENGTCFVLRSIKPLEFEGQEIERFSIGGMAGLKMALQGAKSPSGSTITGLRIGDKVYIHCIGETPSTKVDSSGNPYSPRVDFEIQVTRSM